MRTLQDYQRAYQGQDKRLHFVAGVIVGFGGGLLGGSTAESMMLGVLGAAAVGAGKEFGDALHNRDWSAWSRADFTATVAGGVVGAVLAALLRVVF